MSNRYEFQGLLVAETGLHIGSEQGDFATDARFVRRGDGRANNLPTSGVIAQERIA